MPAASAPIAASGLSPMQQELLNRADSIFDAIGSTVSKASDVAMSAGKAVAAEIPDIAFQYVAYGRAISSIAIVAALILLFICWKCFWRIGLRDSLKIEDIDAYTWGYPRIACMILGIVSGVVGLLTFAFNVKDFVLVWFAPKVWLIMELVELVKRAKG